MGIFNKPTSGRKRGKAFAVFEGGGVKGIGIAGALEVAEKHYQWANVAGTSAGSLIGALVAAGYSSLEIKKMMFDFDFRKMKDPFPTKEVPIPGPVYSFMTKLGAYRGQFLENWVGEKLAAQNIYTFGDLVCSGEEHLRYRLQVITSDISRGRMVILPRDLHDYGLDPDSFPVATAVRMSCAIPFFFAPVTLNYKNRDGMDQVSYFVDGGILSNYPLWLFDNKKFLSKVPTFGFRLVGPNEGMPRQIKGPFTFSTALISTMMEAHDLRYLDEKQSSAKTITIPTLGISATDFDLNLKSKRELYRSGQLAAEAFFNNTSLRYYVQKLFK